MRVAAVLVCVGCSYHPVRFGEVGDAGDDAAIGLDGAVVHDGTPSDWWDPAWAFRMRLSIEDTVALDTGFQVGFAYDLDAVPCAGSRDNVRVVRDQTEVERVIDETGGSQWIWFRLGAPIAATATSTEYWLYCSNPNAGPAPADPNLVFDLFDDFSGSTLASAWSATGGVSVGGGVVTLQNNATFRTAVTYPAGTATDFRMAPSATAPSMYFWGGFQNGSGTASPWVLWNTRNENGIHPEVNDSAGGTPSGSLTAFDTSPRLYGVENYGSSSMYRLDDDPVATLAHPHDIAQSISVRFDNFNSGTHAIEVDMARVRRAVDPPPTVTVGVAETFTP